MYQSLRRMLSRRSAPTKHDRAIAEQLHTMLEDTIDLAGASGLQFYVLNGTVTVVGDMKNPRDRDFLLMLIEEVPGVEEVRSNVQIEDAPLASTYDALLIST